MIDARAYTQVSYIISLMSDNLKTKIPQDFINIIEKNKDKKYEIKEKNVKDIKLLSDTEKILSVIYTDYIASEKEKEIIKNKERMICLRKEENITKYSTEIFQELNGIQKENIVDENLSMVPKTKKKYYKNVINLIKRFFKY